MKIVIDENIPFAREVFGKLGTVITLPASEISPEVIQDASALVVRSMTPVNADLLSYSTVQFVGTATAGCDHVDQAYLQKKQILFASAMGANANSVVEYVLSALFMHARKTGAPLRGKSLGIIGVGHVGQLLAQKAKAVGMDLILNDPPLQRRSGKRCYRSFQECCEADFVSLHVPLSHHGIDATRHLFNEETLGKLRPQTVVINTSRGEVIDEAALFKQFSAGRLARPILDVWANEPAINWEHLQKIEIGTPHIAGYAIDGKIKGTQMIYETLCATLSVMPARPHQTQDLPEAPEIHIDAAGKDELALLSDLTRQAYDLSGDVVRFMALLHLPKESRPAAFEHLRKTYPIRREFQHIPLKIYHGLPEQLDQITALGFKPLPSNINFPQ